LSLLKKVKQKTAGCDPQGSGRDRHAHSGGSRLLLHTANLDDAQANRAARAVTDLRRKLVLLRLTLAFSPVMLVEPVFVVAVHGLAPVPQRVDAVIFSRARAWQNG
jgi:hypothetical protein